jgi:hypothetical protein
MIKGEDVRLVRRPIPELAVAIEHVVDEGAMPILREQPGPFDERRMTEADKRLPRLEVPRFLLHVEALDAQAAVVDKRAVRVWRERGSSSGRTLIDPAESRRSSAGPLAAS